jgi:hypothetical protein
VTYRDLVVTISSITAESSTNPSKTDILSEPISVFIDAGTPHIWLPQSACSAFESSFGLTYDETTDLYLINSILHSNLLSKNLSIVFELQSNSPQKITLSLPYSAFDLELTPTYPTITNKTRYLPLRRAANDSQYTLGRTFLQEAYMIVDYERQNFSIHQSKWDILNGAQQNIIAIDPTTNITVSNTGKSEQVNLRGLIIGASVGGVLGLLLICSLILFFLLRKRRRAKRTHELDSGNRDTTTHIEIDSDTKHEMATDSKRPELDAGMRAEFEGDYFQAELEAGKLAAELDSQKVRLAELDAAAKYPQELEAEKVEVAELDATPRKP